MSQWDKRIGRILSLSKEMRFDELRKVLESCGCHERAEKRQQS